MATSTRPAANPEASPYEWPRRPEQREQPGRPEQPRQRERPQWPGGPNEHRAGAGPVDHRLVDHWPAGGFCACCGAVYPCATARRQAHNQPLAREFLAPLSRLARLRDEGVPAQP